MGLLARFTTSLLVFVFCGSGALKLTDQINPEIHENMKREFVRFAQVYPLKVYLDYDLDPTQYRQVIGWVEVVCGLLLVFGPRFLKVLSSLVCLTIMIGALFTLYMLKEPLHKMIPAAVTFVVLCVNMMLMFQGQEKSKEKKKD